MAKLANERGFGLLDERRILGLWRIGLLRADQLEEHASGAISRFGIESPADERPGEPHLACDVRTVERRSRGYGAAFNDYKAGHADIAVRFHPFRLFVIHHIHRAMGQFEISSTQYFENPDGSSKVLEWIRNQNDSWTASEGFVRCFESWNCMSEIAIALEPTTHEVVFGSRRWWSPDSELTAVEKRTRYSEVARKLLVALSQDEIAEARQTLCRAAQQLDDNKLLHVILRLMSGNERAKLRDAVGAALCFNSMAEVIRRAVERCAETHLPEEDELGFGTWMAGARETVYGTSRIFDATPVQRRDFLTSMGLDAGIKARCYVEGDTEYGAITYATRQIPGIEVVNLRSQFVERGGKGLAFVESLKQDIRSQVFSVVLLDGDRQDSLRALKKAAQDGNFFGRYFVSKPDFEFENFTTGELIEVAAQSQFAGAQNGHAQQFAAVAGNLATTKELFQTARQFGIEIGKSELWGRELARLALERPEIDAGGSRSRERLFVEAVRLLIHTQISGYARSRQSAVVDPETGRLKPKSSK